MTTSGRNKRDISLLFRVFCQKEDYITLEVECNKWRTAALLNLVCRDAGWAAYWWNYEQLEFLTAADARKAESVYRKWLEDKENHTNQTAFELLHRYQENIKAIRLATGLYTKRKAQQIICGDDTKIPKCDGVITRTGATVGILHQKRFIREMLSCTTRICQIH